MERSENINELAAALAKAQGEIEGAEKRQENPGFVRDGKKSRYADLAAVWDACREPLSKNGLAVIQVHEETENQIVIETLLAHSSGQWIKGKLPLKPVKMDPQGIGSATTYARRYALMAMVGIAPEDDDGNASSGVDPTKAQAKSSPKPAPKAAPDVQVKVPATPGAYVVKGGRFDGKKLSEVKPEDLMTYAAELVKAKQTQGVIQLGAAIQTYLDSLAAQDPTAEPEKMEWEKEVENAGRRITG